MGYFMARGKKTGVCSICLVEGENTEWHHIISQSKTNSLIQGDHNFENDLINNLNNIIELCIPCHYQTDSHVFRRRMQKNKHPIPKSDMDVPSKALRFGKVKKNWFCNGTNDNGDKCNVGSRNIPAFGFCIDHANQAPPGHPQHQDYTGPDPITKYEIRDAKYEARDAIYNAEREANGTSQCTYDGYKHGYGCYRTALPGTNNCRKHSR